MGNMQARLEAARASYRTAPTYVRADVPDLELSTDEDLEAECEALWAKRIDLDKPAYPYRGVYFIACASFVKVGIADSVLRRFKDLDATIPIPIAPIGWIPCRGDRADLLAMEQAIHQQFASKSL